MALSQVRCDDAFLACSRSVREWFRRQRGVRRLLALGGLPAADPRR